MNKPELGDTQALLGALAHAREMAHTASDIRMRNFNFFLVIVGALVAGHLHFKESWGPIVLSLSGVVVSVFFFALDLRMRELLKIRVDQLESLEPEVWKRAGMLGREEIPRSGPLKFANHKWIYRSCFVLTGLGSLGRLLTYLTR
ncbi:MAG TPA: hypothetical protein VHE13_03415 [Opitutus sp.]|nr:hypothetical protein [Opitutus sp.]